jgi:ABC-2 type transport system ATP-binding protein
MTDTGVTLDTLVIERGGRRILDGLSLNLAPGSVYALLGGNGAGKSTTLFALLGLLKPDSGQIRVAGLNPVTHAEKVRESTAYLAENVALYGHMTARENVTYFLSLAGQTRHKGDMEAAFASVRLDASAWDRRVESFSKGMRQKTAIALAFLRKTPVLLLDEPTSGLDPAASADFHALLGDLKARGVAVLMVTHDVLGAADTADTIGLLDQGRLAKAWHRAEGPYDLAALHRAFSGKTAA